MKLILPRQVSAADRYAVEVLGNNILDMIDSAAKTLFEHCIGFTSVTVLCGGGNNGADGLCAAKKLMKHGVKVTVRIISKGGTSGINPNCRHYYEKLLEENCDVKVFNIYKINENDFADLGESIGKSDALLECLLGTGYVAAKDVADDDNLYKIIRLINEKAKYVISADIPAGVEGANGQVAECAVKADETVTFSYMKVGHVIMPGKSYCGKISVEEVRVPQEAYAVSIDTKIEFFSPADVKAIKKMLQIAIMKRKLNLTNPITQ
jgi:NAD(P)H-hydrate epimerase